MANLSTKRVATRICIRLSQSATVREMKMIDDGCAALQYQFHLLNALMNLISFLIESALCIFF
jgi:hypothetical protein